MGSLLSWLTKKKEPEIEVLDPLAKPTTWIEDYGMSYIPPDLHEKIEEARRKMMEKEEARRREGAFPYYGAGGVFGGLTTYSTKPEKLDERVFEEMVKVSFGEAKKSCTIPGCKTQCIKHNDYGDFICDPHYKTWKENNA